MDIQKRRTAAFSTGGSGCVSLFTGFILIAFLTGGVSGSGVFGLIVFSGLICYLIGGIIGVMVVSVDSKQTTRTSSRRRSKRHRKR